MVTNIPNNNVKAGVEVMNYVTPFSLEFTEDGEFITDPVESAHPLIIAVFKQNSGKILTDEAQRGCSKVNKQHENSTLPILKLRISLTAEFMTTRSSQPSTAWSWWPGTGCPCRTAGPPPMTWSAGSPSAWVRSGPSRSLELMTSRNASRERILLTSHQGR